MLAPELRNKVVSTALESVCNGGHPMSELKIREMEQGEEFAAWFSDLLDDQDETNGTTAHVEERYLVLTSDIGDWIGGLRYTLRGGVAHLLELAVTPTERHQGYGHRLLHAFEEHATAGGGTWPSSGPRIASLRRSWPPSAGAGRWFGTITSVAAPGTCWRSPWTGVERAPAG